MAQLVGDCVESVVYTMKDTLEKLHEANVAKEQAETAHTKKQQKQAQSDVWHAVIRFKWMMGDGTFVN